MSDQAAAKISRALWAIAFAIYVGALSISISIGSHP